MKIRSVGVAFLVAILALAAVAPTTEAALVGNGGDCQAAVHFGCCDGWYEGLCYRYCNLYVAVIDFCYIGAAIE